MHPNNIDQTKALDFILGGNALFTLLSTKSGVRFTYKVLKDIKREGYLRVYLMNGTDNTKDYKMLGEIKVSSPSLHPLSVHTKETPAFIAFDYVYMNLCVKYPMPTLEIWHEGRCCRCGRVLTVPTSIELGIGPECIFKEQRIAR